MRLSSSSSNPPSLVPAAFLRTVKAAADSGHGAAVAEGFAVVVG
ncbi:hypothetical protein [Prosthecobacter sp.]|nr:hypothetical protein [Prosthecobacter sp.]